MSEDLNNDIIATHTMGGKMEFERTGIYPNKLRISSIKHLHNWNIKVTDEIQSGVLKIKRVPVYNYIFDETGFRIQEVIDGIPSSEWFYVGMTIVMND